MYLFLCFFSWALLFSLTACDETQQIVLGPIMDGVSEDDALLEADVSYYSDWEFTERIMDTVEVGTTVYTKVVFSRTECSEGHRRR